MKKIRTKILLSIVLSCFAISAILGMYSIFNLIAVNNKEIEIFKHQLINDYDTMIQNQVQTASTLLDFAYQEYQIGNLSENQAQDLGKQLVKELRYGLDGYFWIDNINGVLEAHPLLPQNEGANRINITDPKGTFLIQNIINATVQGIDNGFSEYLWEKPEDVDTGALTLKRAYSALFAPWNWVISTGNYIDNLDALVSARTEEQQKNLHNNIMITLVFILISGLITIFIGLVLSNKISKPIAKMVESIKQDDQGNITVQHINVNSQDEIGLLANAINIVTDQIKVFVDEVAATSKNLTNNSVVMNNSADLLENSTQITFEYINEINQHMQEVSHSVEEINASTEDIEKAIASITQGTEQGAILTSQISSIAHQLTIDSTKSREKTQNIYTGTKKELEEKITEVKKVEQIKILSEEISKIADSINLLSLNASIEAARAGEHGRGFAVVADEIRKLAETTEKAVSGINTIVQTVISSVGELVDSSNNVLEFIDKDVLVEFNKLVQAGQEYDSGIQKIDGFMTEFSATSQELNSQINEIVLATKDVAGKVGESAQGIHHIAQQTAEVVDEIAAVKEKTLDNKANVDSLERIVNKFNL